LHVERAAAVFAITVAVLSVTPANPDRDAELREFLRALRERNAKRRANVLRHAENLRRIAEELRARGR
jgi:hypothetical protein